MFTRPGYDPDASALFAALITAGATVSTAQKTAIDTFIRAEKTALRWDLHKRLHMPVWGVAAANAICWKSRTTGTFVGGVTHAAGYVQGDGSTGYFNIGSTYSALGLTNADGLIGTLCTTADARSGTYLIGSAVATSAGGILTQLSSLVCRLFQGASPIIIDPQDGEGITIVGLTASNARYVYKRKTASSGVIATDATAATVAPPAGDIYCMARNAAGTAGGFANNRHGAWVVGLGLSSSDAASFSLNLKTCWESITGLTLP